MSDLTLTLIQTSLYWQQAAPNREMFSKLFATITHPTDAILLPEMFSTGFSMDTSLAETMEGETVAWMKQQASMLNVPVAGSVMIKDKEQVVNRFIWMHPDGSVQFYDKRHLFRMGDEHTHFAAGTAQQTIDYKGWKLRLLVCYDLRFPVWIRRTPQQDYDALLIVANWPQRREHHWRTLLQARAIENQSYVVAVNRVGEDGKGVEHSGYSGLISPKGEWECELIHEVCAQNVTLRKQEVMSWRTDFPAWQDADDFSLS
jgi:predicted amidohydrolase